MMGRVIDREKGGMIPRTGKIKAHKGELVVPKKAVKEVKEKVSKGKGKVKNAPFWMS